MSKTFSIMAIPFYRSTEQCYIKVLTLDRMPDSASPINQIAKRVQFHKLSPFKTSSEYGRIETCGVVILNPNSPSEYARLEDIPVIFNWLMQHGYTIDTAITQMFNQGEVRMANPIICFITQQN